MNGKLRRLMLAGTTVVIAAMIWSGYIPRLGARQQDQQDQTDQQKSSDQQNQDQSQSDQGKKKKGGLLGGIKSMTSAGSGQSKETASAGTKGALPGKAIAEMTPTAADRQAVTDMENLSIPPGDVKKFGEDGHLQPK